MASEHKRFHTSLLRSDALDDDKDPGVDNITAAIDEVLQRHQAGQRLASAEAEWLGVHTAIVAVLMEH